MDPTDGEKVPEARPGPGWLLTNENGRGMLAAWVVGTSNVRKVPVDDTGRTVHVGRHDRTGVVTAEEVAFTAADRQTGEESIEEFLQTEPLLTATLEPCNDERSFHGSSAVVGFAGHSFGR